MSVEVPYETNLYYIYDRVKVDLLLLWILLLYSRVLLIVMNANYLMFKTILPPNSLNRIKSRIAWSIFVFQSSAPGECKLFEATIRLRLSFLQGCLSLELLLCLSLSSNWNYQPIRCPKGTQGDKKNIFSSYKISTESVLNLYH